MTQPADEVLGPPKPGPTAEQLEQDGAPSNVLQAWSALSKALLRDLPASLKRAELSRRRLVRRR